MSGSALPLRSRWRDLSYTLVDVGGGFTRAVTTTKTLLSWGRSDQGQCHDPISSATLPFADIAVGNAHVVALRSNGSLFS